MNRNAWNRLTPAEKAHLADLLPVYFFYNTTDSAAKATAGVPPENLFSLSAADRAALATTMAPQRAEWVKKADAAGLPGQKILDEAVRLMPQRLLYKSRRLPKSGAGALLDLTRRQAGWKYIRFGVRRLAEGR